MHSLRTKWYQWLANKLILTMKTAPPHMIPYLYGLGMDLNQRALDKGIWLD